MGKEVSTPNSCLPPNLILCLLLAPQINYASAYIGSLSIAVPGEISGLYEAWKQFGRVPWSELFQPTIQLCEEGFAVEKSMATSIEFAESIIRNDPLLRFGVIKSLKSV